MKNYLSSIIAVAIAVLAFSFTSKGKLANTHVFEYSGNFSKGSVEALGSWSYVGESQPLCDDTPERACRIAVPDAAVDDPEEPTQLDSEVSITASNTGGTEYVTTISGTGIGSTISNKQD